MEISLKSFSFLLPSIIKTISPFILAAFSINSDNFPLITSSYFFDISLTIDAFLSPNISCMLVSVFSIR